VKGYESGMSMDAPITPGQLRFKAPLIEPKKPGVRPAFWLGVKHVVKRTDRLI
jgi:hypothetical protein